jgi:hypothetical protein
MATGDPLDCTARLMSFLPVGWFPPGNLTRIYAQAYGAGQAYSTIWGQQVYVTLQTRVATCTGAFVDLASYDFFGPNLPRIIGESDLQFSTRIREEVLRDRNTRNAIDSAVFDLTGVHPTIVEPWRPFDTKCFDADFYWDSAGCWSQSGTFMVFITMPSPQGSTSPVIGGWNTPIGYFDAGLFYWMGEPIQGLGVTIAEILGALNRVRTAGITYFVEFTGFEYFVLNVTPLDSIALLD